MPNPIPVKLIKQVVERDDSICQICGSYEAYPLHHIIYGGTGRRRIHRVENLITLCRECHEKVHSDKMIRTWSYKWSRDLYGSVIDDLLKDKWSG